MSSSSFAAKMYQETDKSAGIVPEAQVKYTITNDITNDDHSVTVDGADYPYIRAALIKKYMVQSLSMVDNVVGTIEI